jgi:hypothetical protein
VGLIERKIDMAEYAQVLNGLVVQVIIADQEFINSLPDSQDYVLACPQVGLCYSYNGESDLFFSPSGITVTCI